MIELSLEVVQAGLPKKFKGVITQSTIDEINHLAKDPDYGEEFKEAVITHTSILGGNEKWSMAQYITAVKFYSLTACGTSQVKAYTKVFPERLQARLDRDQGVEDMRGEASRFNGSELVNKIRNQALVPLHLVNQGTAQKAINILTDIAINGRSEVARVSAASALLKELKPPEAAKIELDISIDKGTVIDDYEQAMRAMVAQQKELIAQGGDLKAITNASIKRPEEPIIDVEVDDELSD